MTGDALTLLETALNLNEHDRADLAARLLASLDQDPVLDASDAEQEWADESVERARHALADPSTVTDWADVQARLVNRHQS